jgi:copper homeostasis protein
MKLEICAANLLSGLTAEKSGADRIELCSALSVGGLTPSAGLIATVLQQVSIPVFPLIRVREGNFCFSEIEIEAMILDIDFCKKIGCAGIVVGALNTDNSLNINALRRFSEAADGLELVCHRAFDFTKNPFDSMEKLIDLGFKRILTSGAKSTAFEGRELLKKLVDKSAGRIEIMAGAGIRLDNFQQIIAETGVDSIHLSASKIVHSDKNGLENLSLNWQETDAAIVRKIKKLMVDLN